MVDRFGELSGMVALTDGAEKVHQARLLTMVGKVKRITGIKRYGFVTSANVDYYYSKPKYPDGTYVSFVPRKRPKGVFATNVKPFVGGNNNDLYS